ncbi:hypothetical protein RB597_003107 [Gaeumannomyces tritici]
MTGKLPAPHGQQQRLRAKTNEDKSFPGLKPAAGGPTKTTTQYEEMQKEELTVLRAVYADDLFEAKESHGAWKKTEPRFDIRIRASSDNDVNLKLGVVLTATYPKSIPILTLKDCDGLRESTLFKIQKYVEREPKVFAEREDVMIDVLVEGIREILEEAAQAEAQGLELPSLEEERAAHEAELARQAEEERRRQEQKRLEETKEEERVMSSRVEDEMNRQRAKKLEIRKKNRSSQMPPDRAVEDATDAVAIVFDQPCRLVDAAGNDSRFNTVVGRTLFRSGAISNIYLVRPVLAVGLARPNLALKQAELKSGGKDAAQFKKQLQLLESQLEQAKKNRHSNLLDVMEFRMERRGDGSVDGASSSDWLVSILMPFAERGSLQDLLEIAGDISIDKVRSWTRDLLEGLNFLHTNGIVHKSIHPGNVLLFRDATGSITPKLADAGFQREIRDICLSTRAVPSMREAKSAYWFAPEVANTAKPHYTQKTDIWDFGVMFLQTVFGLDVPQRYESPNDLKASLSLSPELDELVSSFFSAESAKRKRAFDLSSSHFLATNAPVLVDDTPDVLSDSPSVPRYTGLRARRGSVSQNAAVPSRWAREWIEESRLGKGGFGEVVKARNVVESVSYAVKKIRLRADESLTPVVSEISVFSRMSHPSVVRYVGAWIEDIIVDGFESSDESSGNHVSGDISSRDAGSSIELGPSHGALDFISSSRHGIEFGYDSDNDDADTENGDDDDKGSGEPDDDEEGEDGEDDEDEDDSGDEVSGSEASADRALAARKRRLHQRPIQKMIYIVMEYCEKRTLRDLIANNLSDDTNEIWRLFRQMLEGMQHIHALNIIHRDLKPENIFIKVGADGTNMVKIGDFGLATAGMRAVDKNSAAADMDAGDMTRSIGTSTYLAPEVRSGAKGTYTSKCDMYALGIIFFEMCYPPMLGMERAMVFEKLRGATPTLPADFRPTDKKPSQVVLSLVKHSPEARPSATELLRSGILPVEMEGDAMRQVLASLEDPNSLDYYDYVSAFFKRPIDQTKDYTWDLGIVSKGPAELMRLVAAKDTLVSIFRRHGAVEVPRSGLYPPSPLHIQGNTVRVVDSHGALLQMPYDLMMGNARVLAKCTSSTLVPRSYSFGTVFRDKASGGQPHTFGEAHFDVVTDDVLDLALKEAEAIKVLDEIIASFPSLSSGQMCFHVSHSELLRHIFDFCGVERAAARKVADTLSKLNIRGVTWTRIKSELRSAGVSTTTVDELQKFDFRDTPSKVSAQLKTIFQRTNHFQLLSPTLAHLKEMSEYCKRFGVRTKMFIVPLWSWNEVFFAGGIMFSCLFDKRSKEIFAAGGRYDALIKEQRPRISTHFEERHAVGFGFTWERLAQVATTTGTSKAQLRKRAAEEAQGITIPKRVSTGSTAKTPPNHRNRRNRRMSSGTGSKCTKDANDVARRKCDVLVASFDPTLLRTAGIDVLQMLWAQDISAELARDARSPEELVTKHREDSHYWHVIVKQQDMVKVKTPGRKDAPDADMPPSQLCQWLRAEMRERESRTSAAAHAVETHHGYGAEGPHGLHHHQVQQQEVRVLMAQTRSKKSNRQALVEQAQAAAARLVSGFLAGPVAAIETTDAVMDLIRSTALSDAESWRRAEQAVGSAERKYMRELHEMLENFKIEAAYQRHRGGGGAGGSGSGSGTGATAAGGSVAGGSGGAGSGVGVFVGAGSYGSHDGGGGGGSSLGGAFGMSQGGGGVGVMPAFVYNFRTGSCLYYDLGM